MDQRIAMWTMLVSPIVAMAATLLHDPYYIVCILSGLLSHGWRCRYFSFATATACILSGRLFSILTSC